jgi:hypothetical protein
MILEAVQVLCAVNHKNKMPAQYRLTHANHPCTIWAGLTIQNYLYVMGYASFLNKEAKRRYNRKTDHKSIDVMYALGFPGLPDTGLTAFAKCVADEFKSIKDPVEAYRAYYKTKTFATWKYSEKPSWII